MKSREIVAIVFQDYRKYWTDTRKISHRRFLSILGLSEINPSNVTKTLEVRPKEPSQRIITALDNVSVQEALEKALNLEGLFHQKSEDKLRAFLEATTGENYEDKPRIWKIDQNKPDKIEEKLASSERLTVSELANLTIKSTKPVIYWKSDFDSGATFICHALARAGSLNVSYQSVYIIQPTNLAKPFQSELRNVADALHITTPGIVNATELLKALRQNNSLLIICNAEHIPSSSSSRNHSVVFELFEEAVKLNSTHHGPPVILLSGELMGIRLYDGDVEFAEQISDTLKRSETSRYSFYCDQIRRFAALRGKSDLPHGPSRLKRARWHYRKDKNNDGYPINVRLRAFFASNHETHAYFDPTAGFSRLAGNLDGKLPLDIDLHKHDIDLFIQRLKKTDQDKQLKVLRYLSTAVYWLTTDALKELSIAFPAIGVKSLSKTAFDKSAHQLRNVVRCISPNEENKLTDPAYILGMGVKAIIQDEWKRNAPIDRALAHYRIAKRLYYAQHNKDKLSQEFPYIPNWGRSRIYFLAECIRHLVRSCEHVGAEGNDFLLPERVHEFPDKFEDAHPRKALNFCFDTIFNVELNGNLSGRNSRSLSTRHGAYALSAELLELMSVEGSKFKPHWAIKGESRNTFLRDAAFTLLDLGKQTQSSEIFSELHGQRLQDEDRLMCVESALDLVLINTTCGRIKIARKYINNAESFLHYYKASVNIEDQNYQWRQSIQPYLRRLESRTAHLKYLNGNFCEAIKIFGSMKKSSIKRDVAHCYIAALGSRGNSDDYDVAMNHCLSNLFELSSAGFHHEALGFQIALGHLFRKIGMIDPAATCLNQVQVDIMKYGCSERTYLAFLLEAGRIYLKKGKAIKAYLLYLKPCVERAAHGEQNRVLSTALKHSNLALEIIGKEFCSLNNQDDWEQLVKKSTVPSSELQSSFEPRHLGFFTADPLASWDFELDFDSIAPLANKSDIDTQKRLISEYSKKVAQAIKRDEAASALSRSDLPS